MAHPSRTPPPAPSRPDRTRDLVESLLERRIRLTLRKMCQVVCILTFTAAAFSTVRVLLGQLSGAWGTIILSTIFGAWCLCIVGAIDRGKPRETYRAMLWPIFLGPSLMLASAALHQTGGVASVLNSAVTLAYFLCVVFSAALFDRGFTLKVTAVSLVSYLAIYALLARSGLHRIAEHVAPLDAIFAERIGSESSYVMRALVLAAAGFLMAALIGVAYDVVIEVSSVIAEFGTVIDPRVRDLMLAGEVGDGGEEREATVLFADIRGFTSFAEKWEPAPLLRLMKDYFDLMGDPSVAKTAPSSSTSAMRS